MANKLKLKTGDLVQILAGKDRGKRGKVLQTLPADNRVVVDGVRQTTKHAKSRTGARGSEKGQKITFFSPIDASNVGLICPKCQKLTRLSTRILADGKKARGCKHCGESF